MSISIARGDLPSWVVVGGGWGGSKARPVESEGGRPCHVVTTAGILPEGSNDGAMGSAGTNDGDIGQV